MKVYSNPDTYNGADTVITIGMFDGVHEGHKQLLSHVIDVSNEISASSTVVTFWPHPRLVLSQEEANLQFITTLDEKTKLISQIGVQQIILLPFTPNLASLSAEEFISDVLIEKLKMKHLVVGFNHRFGKDRLADYEAYKKLAQKYGFGISKVAAVESDNAEISSTVVRQLLNEGEIEKANRILGYAYSIFGTVAGGQQLGRKIGFPTANVSPNEHYKLIPAKGVYACMVKVMGKDYGGMLNIGVRPTVSNQEDKLTIEVHILDFNQQIYSEEILVTFIKKVREEQKFSGLDALIDQIKQDEIQIRNVLNNFNIKS